jgi:hypothetical protein
VIGKQTQELSTSIPLHDRCPFNNSAITDTANNLLKRRSIKKNGHSLCSCLYGFLFIAQVQPRKFVTMFKPYNTKNWTEPKFDRSILEQQKLSSRIPSPSKHPQKDSTKAILNKVCHCPVPFLHTPALIILSHPPL